MTEVFYPGQFAILGFKGTSPSRAFLNLIEKYRPAGFLLLEENYESPLQLKSLIRDLKKAAGNDSLFAVDQEPGRVQRFRKGFPASKKPALYVDKNLFDEFRSWCTETASMLRESGINLNLSPVLDTAPGSISNPILTDRAFGDDPDDVAAFADILIEEHRKFDILTCGKHFPGLGSAKLDPHITMSVSNEPLARFKDYYWEPFRKGIDSGVDLVMTTHLRAASIDREYAATYSNKTIEFLRKDLEFAGPVISDDLAMGGAGDSGSIADSAVRAIEAGHNLLIISGNDEFQIEALESIKNRYARNEMFAKIADENEQIIRKIREKIPQ